jgi:competence protein ComEA
MRQALGLVLAFCLVLGGRVVRHRLLVEPSGNWREHLWLDDLVTGPDEARAAEKPAKRELTGPLPINTCSVDSLTLLPGVGKVLAGRIDEARRSGLVFRKEEDLRRVKGIGPSLSARLSPLVIFASEAVPDSISENSPKSR